LPNSEIAPPLSSGYLISATYYDEYLRVIQTVSDNHLGGLDIVSNQINFTGDVLLTKENHTATGAPVIVQHEFSYDNGKRLTSTQHRINSQNPVTLNYQNYDELGKLKRKYLHKTTTALQTINYQYNIRGWLTDINDVDGLGNDKFAMKLNYTSAAHALYNGNIASMKWKTAMFNTQEYQFEYDKANRLKSALTTMGTGNYSTSYTYYNNGNLKNLTRKGRLGSGTTYGFIDDLTYTYTGNQLLSVNDVNDIYYQLNGYSDNGSFFGNEYSYDANGNMISDQNKSLDSIAYNYLNLPQQIYLSTDGSNEINYLYTANGQKLMKHILTNNGGEQTLDYIGNFVYEDNQLRYILTEEGRALAKSNGSFEYQCFLKDHLGNTRITFNQNSQIIQEDAYYPFGMAMNGLCYQSGVDYENKYLYNGKELQDDFGLDWYDYGARFYDPELGRWMCIDNKAEKHSSITPYAYAGNNPIIFLDPDGNDIVYFNMKGEEVSRTASTTEFRTYVGSPGNYSEASMPKIIKGYESAIYQKYDYNIAAQTYIFNNLSIDQRPITSSGNSFTGDLPSDLDPTLVKAMIIEETTAGNVEGAYGQKGKSDIMQANVTTTSGQTDWNDSKKQFGLEKGESATPNQSLYAGIRILYTKGLKTSEITDKKGTVVGYNVTWRGSDWNSAVKRYNGGGNPNYLQDILSLLGNLLEPTPTNYIKE